MDGAKKMILENRPKMWSCTNGYGKRMDMISVVKQEKYHFYNLMKNNMPHGKKFTSGGFMC